MPQSAAIASAAVPATLLSDTIGNTPLVRLSRMFPGPTAVYAKIEYYNPSCSIKDRIVRHIIGEAESSGRLKPGGTIVEGTSGNTGAAVAAIAAARGYHAILTMPNKVSAEKQQVPRLYGATVIVCPVAAPGSPEHYMQKARDIAASVPGAFFVDQYNNRHNAEAHYRTTGPEIWEQTGGAIDYFVAGGSTGGTLTGAGGYLKERNPRLQVIMPDPLGSVYQHYFRTRRIDPARRHPYQLEGIGKDQLAACMDFRLIDDVLTLSDEEAFVAARELARCEGILGGGSAGANIWACQQLAKRGNAPKVVVTIIPDSGLKYLSKFYDDTWLESADYTRRKSKRRPRNQPAPAAAAAAMLH